MAKKDLQKTDGSAIMVPTEKLEKLDEAANACKELARQQNDSTFGKAISLANAVQTIRDLLTADVMQGIMALQGTKLGFRTDKDRNNGYPVDQVRDCVIEHVSKGGKLVGNQMNIIAGNAYQTKEFFEDRLNEILGRGNWMFKHGIPKIAPNGAVVKSVVSWTDSNGQHEEEIERAIRGDKYSTADSYLGKMDRKAGAWLLKSITGERYDEGALEDAIDVTATVSSGPSAFSEPDEAVPDEAPEPQEGDRDALIERGKEVLDMAVQQNGTEVVLGYLRKQGYLTKDQKFNSLSNDTLHRMGQYEAPFLDDVRNFTPGK